jgi:iron complex outermembrane receptor protein
MKIANTCALRWLISLVVGFPSVTLWAQQAPPNDTEGIQEIVVTAQRRDEKLKDVPISVQSVGADVLHQNAALDTKALTQLFPTLNYSESSSAGSSGFALRGVQDYAAAGSIQPSTALVIDGVPIMRQAEFIREMADIDRIEVLNGPQGTLFGKNSTAGVINILTKRPTDTLEGNIDVGATTDKEYSTRAMINIPFNDTVQLRTNGFFRNQNPLIPNIYPDRKSVGSAESFGGQSRLNISFGDDRSLLLSGSYSRLDSTWDELLPIVAGMYPNYAQTIGLPLGRVTPRVNSDSPGNDILRTYNGTAELNWRLTDTWNLVSVSAYRHVYEDFNGNFDGLPVGWNQGVGFSPNPYNYPVGFSNVRLPARPDVEAYWSEELRLNYASGPINAIMGGFYQSARNDFVQNANFYLNGSLVGEPADTTWLPYAYTHTLVHDKTGSIFGDITYALTGQVKVFGGLRLTRETLDTDYDRTNYFIEFGDGLNPITGAITAPPSGGLVFSEGKSYNNVSGRAGIQWEPNDRTNYYTSYSHGYKGPGTQQSSTLDSEAHAFVNPEIADSFEIGSKVRLFDSRLAIDLAVFYESIKHIQETAIPPGGGINIELVNAGTLLTRGVESTIQLAATQHLKFNGGVVYDKADYHNFRYSCNSAQTPGVGSCAADGTQDISGQPAIGSPRWKGTMDISYSGPLPSQLANYVARIGYVWVSSIQYGLGDDPLTREPSHGLLDASIGFTSNDRHWDLQLYGRNLTDKLFYSGLISAPFLAAEFGYLTRDFHRYGGLSIKYSF